MRPRAPAERALPQHGRRGDDRNRALLPLSVSATFRLVAILGRRAAATSRFAASLASAVAAVGVAANVSFGLSRRNSSAGPIDDLATFRTDAASSDRHTAAGWRLDARARHYAAGYRASGDWRRWRGSSDGRPTAGHSTPAAGASTTAGDSSADAASAAATDADSTSVAATDADSTGANSASAATTANGRTDASRRTSSATPRPLARCGPTRTAGA